LASLILRALAVTTQTRDKLASARAVVAATAIVGILVSAFADMPTGPALVLYLAAATVEQRRLRAVRLVLKA